MKSGNIALKKASENASSGVYSGEYASYSGVGLKTLFYLLATVVGGALGISLFINNTDMYYVFLVLSGILGFICAIVAMRSPRLAFSFGTIYCLMEGMLIGVVSMIFETLYSGIVISAVVGTISVVFACAFVYITGLIKVDNKFYKFLFTLVIGYIISLLLLTILGLLNVISFDGLGINILFMSISTLISALMLISDMNYAAMIVENKGPKELEWMVSFGIAYTVIWIYYEILRWLVIIFGRRN